MKEIELSGNYNKKLPDRFIFISILLLFCFQSCNSLFNLPFFGSKLQVFEIFSLIVMAYAVIKYLTRKLMFFWSWLDTALLLLTLAILLSTFMNYTKDSALESVGSLYLFIFYFIFSRLLAFFSNTEYIVKTGFKGSLIVCVIAGWIGMLIYLIFDNSEFVTLYFNYPYLGDVVRMIGFSSSSNVLVSNICIAGLILIPLSKKIPLWVWIVVLVTILFTLSKEIFLYAAGGAIFFLYKKGKIKRLGLIALMSMIAFIYIGLIYFTFDLNKKNLTEPINPLVVSEEPIHLGNFDVYPTIYLHLAKSELNISQNYWPWGCGKGNFIHTLAEEKANGNYPEKMLLNEPHDIYPGLVAECGLAGLIALIFFPFAIWKTAVEFRKNNKPPFLVTSLFFILILITIESLALGTLQFRHYWIVFAVLNAFYIKNKFQTFEKDN